MKLKLKGILALFLLLIAQLTIAQDKTTSGTVTDGAGVPVPGVNVLVKGSKSGTQTDVDGKFKVNATAGQTLVFSFTGMKTMEVAASNGMKVKMADDSTTLGEVVVTALGVTKTSKTVTYGISTVSAATIEGRADSDVFKTLEGQVAGLNLNSVGGAVGSGGTVTIRGMNSISGNNQALIIVDGVPLSSSTFTDDGFTASSVTASSRLADIDPNNIAEVSVLKGYAAATLYGTAGKNGVILIKTKSGSKGKQKGDKMDINFSQSYFTNEAVLPKYQDKYGVGTNNITGGYFFSNWGAAFNDTDLTHFTLPNAATPTPTQLTNGVINIAHPYNYIPNVADAFNSYGLRSEFPELQGTRLEYKPYKSVENFFKDGSVIQSNLNINKNFENGFIGASIANHNETGVIPNNGLRRLNISVGGGATLSENWDFTGSINYTNRDYSTPPISSGNGSGTTGVGSSILSDVFYTPRNIDLMGLPFEGPLSGRSVYYRGNNGIQNPRWTAKYTSSTEALNRIVLGTSLKYSFNKNANLLYRFGLDDISQKNEYKTPRGGTANAVTNNGFYRTTNYYEKIFNHDLIYSWNKEKLFVDGLSLTAILGGQAKREVFNQNGISSTGQVEFNFWEHSNFSTSSGTNLLRNNTDIPVDLNFESNENTVGLFGSAEFGYKEFLFLSLQARNDWSSTLEKENNNIFYPSVGLSFVPTAAFSNFKSKYVNFLKLRAAYGSSGSFPDPYQTRARLIAQPNNFVSNGAVLNSQYISTTLGNPNLKPEVYKEIEFGIEGKFFNNRVNLNSSYFMRTTDDLIVDSVPLDYATGYTTTALNVSEVKRKGLEIELAITPFKTNNSSWKISNVFYSDRSEVTKLPAGSDKIQIAGLGDGLGNYAVEGEQFGVMYGNDVLRDDNGNAIVDANGYYQATSEIQKIGDPNPDFTWSAINNFTYKGFEFNMKWDYQSGGDIYSSTVATLLGRGNIGDFDRSQTFILPGVKADGSPNNIQQTAFNYFFNYYSTGNNIQGAIHKNAIWDASHIRLGELGLQHTKKHVKIITIQ
jgi:TonB-linked SusC/RagA family outer membrane protein